ncbi:MAG: WD40-repeat-containing domain protein [Benjaminiella poitrasii]|nr:MAG: WD40-repeat-containing domain protein [Benjaminiella poitrasii]
MQDMSVDPVTNTVDPPATETTLTNMETTEDTTAYYNGTSVFIPDFSHPFQLISSTEDRYSHTIDHCLEQDRTLIQQTPGSIQSHENNYFRNVKWSPDGSCLLSNSADNVIRLFQLPTNVYEDAEDADRVLPMVPTMGIREGESIYDFAWYPAMTMQDPSTCCFLTSVRDHPIQLWDLYSGTVRATYRAIDHRERFIGPNALSFNPDGSKIYCGYENMIEIFDAQTLASEKRPTIATRKTKRRGQNGLISCFDFTDGYYAAGSYSRSIGLYDDTNHDLCLKLMLDNNQGSGVTQVKFSDDGLYLYSVSRQTNSVLCWDVRETENVLFELPRPGKTNQRIQLDVRSRFVVTGDTDGNVLVYDVTKGEGDKLVSRTRVHEDLVSSVALNPVYPVVATCSGQRKFQLETDDDDSDDDSVLEDELVMVDNSIKIWRMKGEYEWHSYDAAMATDMTTYEQQQQQQVA